MANQITYTTRADGDLWTHVECNELKQIVNANIERDSSQPYDLNNIVHDDGKLLKSVVSGNTDTPTLDASDTSWVKFNTSGVNYDGEVKYAVNEAAFYDGTLIISKIDDNIGNTPGLDGSDSNWESVNVSSLKWMPDVTYPINVITAHSDSGLGKAGILVKALKESRGHAPDLTPGALDTFWEIVKTGGSLETEATVATATPINTCMYFNTDGKLYTADNRELSKSFVSGLLVTATTASDVTSSVLSGGKMTGFSGLTPGQDYYLGNSGNLIAKGSIAYSEYIVYIGRAITADTMDTKVKNPEPNRNYDNGLDVGARIQYATYKDRSGIGMLPDDFDNAISQANYSILFGEIGHKWNDAHVEAGDTDLSGSSTLFYPTPPPGYYSRSGIPNSASIDSTSAIDTGNDTITLSEADYNKYKRMKYFTDSYNGVPVYLEGTLPTGLSEETLYYLRFIDDVNFYVTAHTTETGAIANTGKVDITATVVGTFNLTQEGIVIDDAMQKITASTTQHYLIHSGGNSFEGAFIDEGIDGSAAPAGSSNAGSVIGFDSSSSPNARTSNETRPKTAIMFYYTKVEHITTAGEPISATQKIIDWSSTSTWTGGASIPLNHDLGVPFDEYTGKIFVRDPAVPDKIYDATNFETSVSGSKYGQRLNGIDGDSNNCYLQLGITSSTPGRYVADNGAHTIVPATWEYKVVLTKINKVATYADTSFRKVYEITDATNYTFILPDASTQITEYNIKRTGSGAGTVTISPNGTDTIEGSTSDYIMRGDETLRIIPNGTNWAIVSTNEKRVCKAWGSLKGDGTDIVSDGYNIASVTKTATGTYDVTFNIAMVNDTYALVATCNPTGSSVNVSVGSPAGGKSTTGFSISIEMANGNPLDRDFDVMVFGS